MAIVSTPLPQPRNRSLQPFPRRLPLDNPVSPTRLPPVVGKSEKIECTVPTASFRAWFPEVHQRRLLRMNGQIEAIKPLRKHFHYLAGVFFLFAANNKIIGKPDQEASAFKPWSYFFYIPLIQHMMQKDVTQYR